MVQYIYYESQDIDNRREKLVERISCRVRQKGDIIVRNCGETSEKLAEEKVN